jgi:ABC-2 type transport system permease protein
MGSYCTLTRRELGVYFVSLTGYVVMAVVTLLVGLNIVYLLSSLGGAGFPVPLTELFFNNLLFWTILTLVTPIMTMRLFALEKSSGTFETLMTTQVTDLQVVAAKFTAAIIFYMICWLPAMVSLFIVSRYSNQAGSLDVGTLIGMYFGIFIIGCLYVSFGCLASAMTRSQMVAAIISLAFGFGLLLLILSASRFDGSDWQSRVLSMFNFGDQFRDFLRGVLDTRVLVFHLSLSFFFLFLTLRIVESRHWK